MSILPQSPYFCRWNILIERCVASFVSVDYKLLVGVLSGPFVCVVPQHLFECLGVMGALSLGRFSFEMPDQSWCRCEGFVLDLMGALFVGFAWFSLFIIACHGLVYFG